MWMLLSLPVFPRSVTCSAGLALDVELCRCKYVPRRSLGRYLSPCYLRVYTVACQVLLNASCGIMISLMLGFRVSSKQFASLHASVHFSTSVRRAPLITSYLRRRRRLRMGGYWGVVLFVKTKTCEALHSDFESTLNSCIVSYRWSCLVVRGAC